jgi:hypothetical protein
MKTTGTDITLQLVQRATVIHRLIRGEGTAGPFGPDPRPRRAPNIFLFNLKN